MTSHCSVRASTSSTCDAHRWSRQVTGRVGALTLENLRSAYYAPARMNLTRADLARVRRSRATIEKLIAGGATAYGVNTGFGSLPRRASRAANWRSCSTTWCCRTRPALANR